MNQSDVYIGTIVDGSHEVFIDGPNGVKALPHLVRHSPDGFSWGYAGSGPADLSLAILAHALGYTVHPLVYQRFKAEVIQHLDMNTNFKLERTTVLETVERIKRNLNIQCLRCVDRGYIDVRYCECAVGKRYEREDSMGFDEAVQDKQQ